MIKQLSIVVLCFGLAACVSAPQIDTRPRLVIAAEKSLQLGVDNYNESNFEKAQAHFDRALFLYRNIDDPIGIISSCINIAKTKLGAGHINSAQQYVNQAKAVSEYEKLTRLNSRISIIESSIAIENDDITKAKSMLDGLLKNPSDDTLIRTAAIQNRTRLAFIENMDAANWVRKYENAIQQSGQNTALNEARLLRFKSTLEPDKADTHLGNALTLYRKAAHSPGIASTLTEWATHDITKDNYTSATNKLKRALFIRTTLQDQRNSMKVLQQLSTSYKELGESNRSERARYWQNKLNNKDFQEWENLQFEFDHFPG